MSFTFGFGGDDIEADEEQQNAVEDEDQAVGSSHMALIPPKSHTLVELLSSLPSQVSYNTLQLKPSSSSTISSSERVANIQKRSVFDIRVQLMTETNPEESTNNLVEGLENGDLSSGIYEGGFKTWECAIDLAELVLSDLDLNQNWHIIELGAGTAVPSLAILHRALERSSTASASSALHFTLCDYNEDVLRLATAPNVFLNFHTSKNQILDEANNTADDDLDIEALGPNAIDTVVSELQSQRLTFDFVSGGWGDEFNDLVSSLATTATHLESKVKSPVDNTLILASETIYSPESTKIFIATLMSLLRRNPDSQALVAAKKVYFGVGGGIDDFVAEVKARGGETRIVRETANTGVGRIVLRVTIPKELS